MLPEKYHRLWRRRLRRRPLLPFLLAAIVAVDAAIALGGWDGGTFGSGFIAGQMSLLAIWITNALRGFLLRAAVALVVSFFFAGVAAYPGDGPLYDASTLFAIFASVIFTLIATSAITAGLVRLAARRMSSTKLKARQRVTIAVILQLTLVAAILLAVFRDVRADVFADPLVVGLIVAGVVPTLWVSIVIAFLSPGWPRAITAVGIPLAASLPLFVAEQGETLLVFFLQTLFCGVAIVLLDWRKPFDETVRRQQIDEDVKQRAVPDASLDLTA